jgi:two-component system OmpR family response regulator
MCGDVSAKVKPSAIELTGRRKSAGSRHRWAGDRYLKSGRSSPMRVLVVEDDRKLGSFVVGALEQAGYIVDLAEDGVSGLSFALRLPYDAAVVDLMLPRLGGLEVIDEIRRRRLTTPIIVLSAKRSVEDRVRGLRTGCDDYLVKPFSLEELLARVEALIRRGVGSAEPTELNVADLTINLATREVKRGGQCISLQAREFTLLSYLVRNAGRPVSKAMILDHVWNLNFDPQTNVADVLVCRLRSKIDKDFSVKLIHTLRGVGYVVRDT